MRRWLKEFHKVALFISPWPTKKAFRCYTTTNIFLLSRRFYNETAPGQYIIMRTDSYKQSLRTESRVCQGCLRIYVAVAVKMCDSG